MKNWGIGHAPKQNSFFKTKHPHRFSHGGTLRQKRAGRKARPLSTKQSLHLVLKVNTQKLSKRSLRNPVCFKLTLAIIKKYSKKFSVKIEQVSVQHNHIHALIRTTKRSQYQHFFRVAAGQIAQCFEKEGLLESGVKTSVTDTPKSGHSAQLKPLNPKPLKLWLYRPFTRVVLGLMAYQIVRNYIQLNEKEVRGEIRYQKNRLRGLSSADWKILWA